MCSEDHDREDDFSPRMHHFERPDLTYVLRQSIPRQLFEVLWCVHSSHHVTDILATL